MLRTSAPAWLCTSGTRPLATQTKIAITVVDATADDFSGAIQVDGKMIDEPVIIAARRTLARAKRIASAAIG